MKYLLALGLVEWLTLGAIGVLFIGFFIYSYFRNKKDQDKTRQMSENLSKGDKVLTTAGIVGKIINIENKDGVRYVTIETGDNKNKGYLTMDSAAIYIVLDKINAPAPTPVEEKPETLENNAEATEKPQEKKEVKAKKSSNKSKK